MDRKLPDREQLLGEVFDVVRQHQPLNECSLQEKIQETGNNTSKAEVSIALCMLQARGLVQYFTVEAAQNNEQRISRKRPPDIEVMYRLVEIPEPAEADNVHHEQTSGADIRPSLFQKLFG